MTNWYLGLATTGHDPALALVNPDGKVVFAEATERYLQDKRAWGASSDHATHLADAFADVGIDPARDTMTVATTWAKAKSIAPVTLPDIMLPAKQSALLGHLQANAQNTAGAALLRFGFEWHPETVMRFDHHLCHVASALYQSDMNDAVCLVLDGEGEAGAAAAYDITDRRIKRRWRSWGPGSFGTFYGWLTYACGFDWQKGEEWKVMGLAAFGQARPDLVAAMTSMMLIDDGRLRFAPDDVLLAAQQVIAPHRRAPGDDVMQAADLAASGQRAYALMADQVLQAVLPQDPCNLILTGGCALNSSYNGTIEWRFDVTRVMVPSAPGDDGNAVGAALLAWMNRNDVDQVPRGDGSAYLGSIPSHHSIVKAVEHITGCDITDCRGNTAHTVAHALQDGKIIGVMRGRAEFGPRALGNRSILADPRSADTKDRINRLVKGREAYRPFAPVIPADQTAEWFERAQPAPYMSFTLPWRKDKAALVPAVVHEDATGRLQTVDAETAPWLHAVVTAFGQATGVPVILNTSFNIMGKPIAHSVEDAIAVFMTSGLDCLLLEDMFITKRTLTS